MIIDLDQIKQLTADQQNHFEVLRYTVQWYDDTPDDELDALVDQIAAPIIEAIDCTQCANCCRSLDVYLTPEDGERLGPHIDIPLDAILDRESAQRVGEWGKFAARPCRFLDGKRCSVYEHRPETCRTYPALTPDFRWTLADTIEGAAICPIIYNVLVRLADRFGV